MFCHKCGTQCQDNSNFCTNCGADLTSSAQSEVVKETPIQPQAHVQPIPQQPTYQVPVTPPETPANGLGIASLILGIVSFFCCPTIAAILAIIFGVMAKKRGNDTAMPTAGIICGIIGLVVSLIIAVIYIAVIISEGATGLY